MKDTLRLVGLAVIMGFSVSYVMWGRKPNAAPKSSEGPGPVPPPVQPHQAPGLDIPNQKRSKLRLEPEVRNMGTVKPNTTHKVVFEVHNPTEEPIEIQKVVPSCGCVNAKMEQNLIPPKSFSNLTATYSAGRNKPGDKVSIRLHTNEKGALYLTARVEAAIYQALQIIPPSVSFGTMVPGETRSKTFIVKHTKGENFKILGINRSKTYFSFNYEPETAGVLSSYKVTATCTAPDVPVTHRDTCAVITNLKDAKIVPVETLVTVQGPLRVQPESLGGRTLEDGSVTPPLRVLITRRKPGEPIEITSILDSFSRDISYSVSKKISNSLLVSIHFKKPLPVHRSVTGAFLIYTKRDYTKMPLTVRYQILPVFQAGPQPPSKRSDESAKKNKPT